MDSDWLLAGLPRGLPQACDAESSSEMGSKCTELEKVCPLHMALRAAPVEAESRHDSVGQPKFRAHVIADTLPPEPIVNRVPVHLLFVKREIIVPK